MVMDVIKGYLIIQLNLSNLGYVMLAILVMFVDLQCDTSFFLLSQPIRGSMS